MRVAKSFYFGSGASRIEQGQRPHRNHRHKKNQRIIQTYHQEMMRKRYRQQLIQLKEQELENERLELKKAGS